MSNKIKELEQDSVEIQGVVEISENQEIVTIQEEEVNEIINSNSKEVNEIINSDSKEVSEIINSTSNDVNEIVNSESKEEYKIKPNKINKNISKDVVPLITPPNDDSPVLRVQIGAFNRRMKKSVFNGMPNVVGIKGDDGLYRFYSGSFTDKFKAAQHKVDLTLSGYNDAFIVAFQKGKRISLKDLQEVRIVKRILVLGFQLCKGFVNCTLSKLLILMLVYINLRVYFRELQKVR